MSASLIELRVKLPANGEVDAMKIASTNGFIDITPNVCNITHKLFNKEHLYYRFEGWDDRNSKGLFDSIVMTKGLKPEDVHYEYNTRGYMMYFKDKPIGGAGIAKSAKGCRSNIKLFKGEAEYDKKALCEGFVSLLYLKTIIEILEGGK